MAANDSVVQHVSKVQNMARQLTDVCEVVSDMAIMAKVLESLPMKYGALITAWDSVKPASQTIHGLQERLIKEESRLSRDDELASALAAVTVKSKKKQDSVLQKEKKTQQNDSAGIECFYYKKKDHIKRFCRKWKRDGKPGKGGEKRSDDSDTCAFVITHSEDNRMGSSDKLKTGGTVTDEQISYLLNQKTEDVWLTDIVQSDEANMSSVVDLNVWHERLGHVNHRSLCHMADKDYVHGLKFKHKSNSFCETCQFVIQETSCESVWAFYKSVKSGQWKRQNGRMERDNRTIVESARSMLIASKLLKALWAQAINTAVYVLNRTTSTQSSEATPYERWTGKKPSLAHIRIFGSDVYVYIPEQQRDKLDSKAKKLILVGYQGESTNYRLYDPQKKRVFVARDVIFNERRNCSSPKRSTGSLIKLPDQKHEQIEDGDESRRHEAVLEKIISDKENESSDDTYHSPDEDSRQLRDRTQIKRPARFEVNLTECNEPLSYRDAISKSDAKKWVKAIAEELDAHERNGTWTCSPRTRPNSD
ncbi:uncharacterized protein LOC112590100 [Harpegnathos saltator]|uniref:uncharacterized protein LOC112590100 n=1 Tax=Harpegnathos saltator TaxID=610380 RepID=UPI000DBEDEB2|nr:uncharacterized protein LOC112590100 [Harpegnathos saltator]